MDILLWLAFSRNKTRSMQFLNLSTGIFMAIYCEAKLYLSKDILFITSCCTQRSTEKALFQFPSFFMITRIETLLSRTTLFNSLIIEVYQIATVLLFPSKNLIPFSLEGEINCCLTMWRDSLQFFIDIFWIYICKIVLPILDRSTSVLSSLVQIGKLRFW